MIFKTIETMHITKKVQVYFLIILGIFIGEMDIMKIIVSLTHALTGTIIRDIHNYFISWGSFSKLNLVLSF